jgi:hypothetical protein
LYAIWARGGLTPMLQRVLQLVGQSAEHLEEIIG